MWDFAQNVETLKSRLFRKLDPEHATDVEKSTKDGTEEFPALRITLSEARNLLNLEEERQKTLERKSNFIFTVSGSLLAFLSLGEGVGPIGTPIIALVSIGTMILSVWTQKVYEYEFPLGEPEEWYKFAKLEADQAKDEFLRSYIKALTHNRDVNNEKAQTLQKSFWALLVQFALLTVFLLSDPIRDLFVRISGLL